MAHARSHGLFGTSSTCFDQYREPREHNNNDHSVGLAFLGGVYGLPLKASLHIVVGGSLIVEEALLFTTFYICNFTLLCVRSDLIEYV